MAVKIVIEYNIKKVGKGAKKKHQYMAPGLKVSAEHEGTVVRMGKESCFGNECVEVSEENRRDYHRYLVSVVCDEHYTTCLGKRRA